jgi:hypothetical protein
VRKIPLAAFATLAAAAVFACDSAPAYKEPPPASYVASARRVNVDGTAVSVAGASVDPQFFDEAGVRPLLGRFFLDGDRTSPAPIVAVLSYDFWTERFHAEPSIIGRTLDVDGHPLTVVGVAPRGFAVPQRASLWTPLPQNGR